MTPGFMRRPTIRQAARTIEIMGGLCLLAIIMIEYTGGLSLLGISMQRTANPWRLLLVLLGTRFLMAVPGAFRWIRTWTQQNRMATALTLLVLVTASIPRLHNLSGSSLNSDELLWMQRGTHIIEMLKQGEFIRATETLGHPGVPVALLVGCSYTWLGQDVSTDGTGMMDGVSAARLPLAVLGILTCVFLFLLARRIWSTSVALPAALFLALDPIHVGLSRLAHLDCALTFFFMLSFLSYVVGELDKDRRWKVAAGCFLGLSILTKAPGYTLPLILLIWKAIVWLRRAPGRGAVVTPGDVVVVLIGYAIYMIGFTRTWLDPDTIYWIRYGQGSPVYDGVRAVCRLLQRVPVTETVVILLVAVRLLLWRRSGNNRNLRELYMPSGTAWAWAGAGALVLLVFRLCPNAVSNTVILLLRVADMGVSGESALDGIPMGGIHAPWTFYGWLFLVRFSELLVPAALLGIGASICTFISDRRKAAAVIAPLVAAIGFMAIMSPGRRVAMRYILPAVPFIAVLGGMGLATVLDILGRLKCRGRSPLGKTALNTVGVLLIVGVHLPIMFVYYPNYYLYFNSFIGGPQKASERMIVGWGEGQKEAAEFLMSAASGKEINIAVLGETGTIKYYWKHAKPAPTAKGNIGTRALEEADYVVLPLNVVQRNPRHSIVREVSANKPAHVVHLNGVDVTRIYRHDRELVDDTESYKASQKCIDWTTGKEERDPVSEKKVRVGRAERDAAGWLFRGPNRTYAPGKYVARFSVRVGPDAVGNDIAVLDVATDGGDTILASRALAAMDFPSKGEYEDFLLPFSIKQPAVMEFRAYYTGKADFWAYSVKVYPDNAP